MKKMSTLLKYYIALIIFWARSKKNKGKIRVFDIDQTIDELLSSDKSLIRFGDGEISIIKGNDLRFQPFSDNLQTMLAEILATDNKSLMIAIPAHVGDFNYIKEYRKEERIAWVKESVHSYNIYKKYCYGKTYYNSLVSRIYLPFNHDLEIAGNRFNRLKELWNRKSVLIIEGEYSRLGVGNDLFENTYSIRRILCPSQNAFAKVDTIELAIKKHLNKEKYDLVLLAIGPTSKVIIYHLHNLVRMIDLGHIDIEYEWFLRKADGKIAIKGKAVNEAKDGYSDLELIDKKYDEQILEKII